MATLEYGSLIVVGDRITFQYPTDWMEDWSCNADEIAIVGEYTTEFGPCVPDYFWIFVMRSMEWHGAPVGVLGEQEMLELLGRKFPGEWQYRLSGSTDFDSQVLCPFEIAGTPIFEFKKTSIWRRSTERLKLTQPILDYLKNLV